MRTFSSEEKVPQENCWFIVGFEDKKNEGLKLLLLLVKEVVNLIIIRQSKHEFQGEVPETRARLLLMYSPCFPFQKKKVSDDLNNEVLQMLFLFFF
jgi:hypothetical protein